MNKSQLNQYCQKSHIGHPRYSPHKVGDLFVCEVIVDEEEFKSVEGHTTKREAEVDAAGVALQNLVQLHPKAQNVQELMECVEKEQKNNAVKVFLRSGTNAMSQALLAKPLPSQRVPAPQVEPLLTHSLQQQQQPNVQQQQPQALPLSSPASISTPSRSVYQQQQQKVLKLDSLQSSPPYVTSPVGSITSNPHLPTSVTPSPGLPNRSSEAVCCSPPSPGRPPIVSGTPSPEVPASIPVPLRRLPPPTRGLSLDSSLQAHPKLTSLQTGTSPSKRQYTASTSVPLSNDFVKELDNYCQIYKLSPPIYSITEKNKRFVASVAVGGQQYQGTRDHETFERAKEQATLVALACIGMQAVRVKTGTMHAD